MVRSRARRLAAIPLGMTLAMVLSLSSAPPHALTAAASVRRAPSAVPLSFEPNVGQTAPEVRFLTHTGGGVAFFTATSVVLSLTGPLPKPPATGPLPLAEASAGPHADALQTTYVGANPDPTIRAGAAEPGRVNYFIGNDPSRWRTSIPTYGGITYTDLYPGIAATYAGGDRGLETTYRLAPSADTAQLRWRYSGAQRVLIAADGTLDLVLPHRTLSLTAPIAWQTIRGQREPVAVRFQLLGGDLSFLLGAYDHSQPLVIDPTLVYSTYLGGSAVASAYAVTVDAAGDTYVAGGTNATDFPTKNAYQPTYKGLFGSNTFVAEFNPSGSALIYSTYLGGSDYEYGSGLAVDAAGDAYETGLTASADFPTKNAYQPASRSTAGYTAFVAELTPGGSGLVYSTYLGGVGSEWGRGIAVDSSDRAYVTGMTTSPDFPTKNPFQQLYGGNEDAFVTEFAPGGGSLIYSTFLGGANYEVGIAIAVDPQGDTYVTGSTGSLNFPTKNAYQPTNTAANSGSVFVTEFAPGGGRLVYSTYLGGTNQGSVGEGVTVDTLGNIYITGTTDASDFPTRNALQPNFGGVQDAFVTEFIPDGSALVYSTYLGGSKDDAATGGIAVDSSGDAYVAGETASTDFPTYNAFQPSHAPIPSASQGNADGFVTEIAPKGSAFVYSSYLGGSGDDAIYGIAIDAAGEAFVVGETDSTDFPTKNPFQATMTGSHDAFLTRVSSAAAAPSPSVPEAPWAPALLGAGLIGAFWWRRSSGQRRRRRRGLGGEEQ